MSLSEQQLAEIEKHMSDWAEPCPRLRNDIEYLLIDLRDARKEIASLQRRRDIQQYGRLLLEKEALERGISQVRLLRDLDDSFIKEASGFLDEALDIIRNYSPGHTVWIEQVEAFLRGGDR